MHRLPPTPATMAGSDGLATGLTAGRLTDDPVPHGAGRGRVRRWYYAAAADGDLAIGAAVVSLGIAGTAFVWLHHEGRMHTWDRRLLGWQAVLGRLPVDGAAAPALHAPDVRIDADGGLAVHVRTDDGVSVRAALQGSATLAVVCATPTPGGGWNVTEKEAGYGVTGTVTIDGNATEFDGRGWRDWTCGRQDRRTTWRWAAGAGTSADGRGVGLNVSTGMNGVGPGEDVAWIDGQPVALDVTDLRPVADGVFDGDWVVTGEGWELAFAARGVRAADENLLVVSSHYVQPVGVFTGTLPDGDGGFVDVTLTGVTEDHEATW